MDGFVLVIVAVAAAAAGAGIVALRYERELRRMACFLDQREPAGSARMTTGVRTRGMLSLARGVNAELRELQDERIAAQQGRQAFQTGLTCLSHDIRTPLAGAQGYLQLVDGEEDPAEKARFLSAAAHRLGDVRALLDDLFSFAQVHDPSFEVVCEPMKPADVVGDVLMGLYPQFRERGWEPSVTLDDEALALADAEALARIVRNLAANALRHGAAAPVVVQGGARISVENRVANPDALDVDRLFERFYQGEGSRSSGGAGLGLAIVAQLAAAMGATVAAVLEGDRLRIEVALREG
ncbi:HAMP domain-containing histidine kinase [Eggerthella sp. NSJ-70]|uniref:Sensor-like histidine kinase SenX3 n=1 Tax=Eggerthella hominis TaxID=2763043 RepID=A0ABR7BWA6_9ACTN|nr:HAMP domain-containing sensor histidine kinase [Eggerthella hominis]MBC5585872.1 HAMP domain-containing histidine kinase [Eggerthella hominis]